MWWMGIVLVAAQATRPATASGREPLEPVLPRGYAANHDYRQYAHKVIASDELLANLKANPDIRNDVWGRTTLHVLALDPADPANLAQLDTCFAMAAALTPPMPVYPAFRVLPSGNKADQWTKPAYWAALVPGTKELLARRQAGDARIGIDAEAYPAGSLDGDEMTRASLAAAGKTEAQFDAAILPFLDCLATASPRPVVCIYPQVMGDRDQMNLLIVRLLDRLGPRHVQIWWETYFHGPEDHRTDPHRDYLQGLVSAHHERSKFELNYGTPHLIHRLGIDDDAYQYIWGRKWRATEEETYGAIRPWVFDRTRRNWRSWGTPEGFEGTALNSLNDVAYAWDWVATTEGFAETPVSDGLAPALAGKFSSIDPGGVGTGYVPSANLNGVLLERPALDRHGCVRIEGVLPIAAATPFTIDFTCVLSGDSTHDYPVLGSAQYNQVAWQVVRKAADGGLYLQLKSTANTAVEHRILATTAPLQMVRMQIGRDGNTWLHAADDGPIVRVDVGFSVDSLTNGLLVCGAGVDPASFPQLNRQSGSDGLLLPASNPLHVWVGKLLSDEEIAGPRSNGQSPLRGRRYPFDHGAGW